MAFPLQWAGFRGFFVAFWRSLANSRLVTWLSRIYERLLGTTSHRQLSAFERLDGDVLGLILSDLPFDNRLVVSGLSRQLRATIFPILFRNVCWAPIRHRFPPKSMWPHIELFVLAGDSERVEAEHGSEASPKFDYPAVLAELQQGIYHLPLLRTFVVSEHVRGGLWADLWQTLAAIPSLTQLDLEPLWSHISPDVSVTLAPARSNLCCIAYQASMLSYPIARRDIGRLTLETNNLRHIVEGRQSQVEILILPGELLLRVMDDSPAWTSLQRLEVDGFFPYDASDDRPPSPDGTPAVPLPQSKLLTLLEALPNLRTAQLAICALYSDPVDLTYIVGPDQDAPRRPQELLRHLVEFEFSCILSHERLLSFLPHSLLSLSLPHNPLIEDRRIRRHTMSASDLYAMFQDLEFPALEILDVRYWVQDLPDVDAQEHLLNLFGTRFPRLRRLSVFRYWSHDKLELGRYWDPVPAFRVLLSRLPNLQYFQFNPSMRDRSGLLPFARVDEAFIEHVGKLRRLAERIIRDCPWLLEVAMYRALRSDPRWYWGYWNVVTGPNGEISLEANTQPPV
uniref:F-box domain-containing protein n=1 Tax=Mycena chlorophos TaxID=658473 RepID=A0ABQ0LKD0_MYCCL|nr:predicted protein [Mycena chlorophos]